MEKYIITTGKSIDLAIQTALAELSLDRDAVSVEVLENAKSGFLGIGASPAKVKVSYEVPDPKPAEPAPALSAASRKPKKQAPKLEKPLEMPKPPVMPAPPKAEPRKEAPKLEKLEKAEKPEKPEQPRKQAPRKDAPKAAPKAEKTYAPAEPGSQEERVERFLKGLLERMESDAVPHAFRKDAETIGVELVGEDLGALIGRRGETLDAIQHLANYALNHDSSKRTRVTVDAENYRGKREESLRHLARKMAAKVVKYRKNMTLEPMNAYERHVIHATLQDVPNVTTYSTGTEPNRRVVIAYEK
ncbi:MAG: Jag N-terminal domain-containing protein [Oscillospiraceae bacterium]|nr:Jag N-terminal domain-containing protein [Oscillospiraceae bacterium]MBR4193702.1 Jag N-terminal domain-containing protein [Oscillospiraceae bacterium]